MVLAGETSLSFGALEPGEGSGLRGALPSEFRWDCTVRAAHGWSLVTSVQASGCLRKLHDMPLRGSHP